MIDLSNKNALVTGAAVGIGRGVSKVLAEQGANVVVSDIDSDGAKSTSEEIIKAGGLSQSAQLDVTDKESVQTLISDLSNQLGHIDIVVNNAGVVGAQGWWERKIPNDDDWDQVHSVNVRGVARVTQAVSPHMKEMKYGKVVNIASIAGRRGSPDLPHYSTTKAAVISLTQSSALELAEFGINVNAICPGLLWTPMWEAIARRRTHSSRISSNDESGREFFERVVQETIPLKREQTPVFGIRPEAFSVHSQPVRYLHASDPWKVSGLSKGCH